MSLSTAQRMEWMAREYNDDTMDAFLQELFGVYQTKLSPLVVVTSIFADSRQADI